VLLNIRSITVSAAVICFFTVGLVGLLSEVSPFTCCKRAMTGAIAAFVVTAWAVKAINAVLINAMVKSQTNKQRKRADVGRD
jgi:cbb3-type cytochrome oxidase subunit 1